MKYVLDSMEQYYNGPSAKFDETKFNELLECMSEFDDDLVKATERTWKVGFIDYFKSNGT